MSELYKILLTSFLTVTSGVLVLAIGKIIEKFVIEPLHEQKKLIADIANALILYANVGSGIEQDYIQRLSGVKEKELEDAAEKLRVERLHQIIRHEWTRTDNAKTHLRQQASELMGKTDAIPFYSLWAFLYRRPSYEDVTTASSFLIGMANSSNDHSKEVAKLLKIKILAKRLGA